MELVSSPWHVVSALLVFIAGIGVARTAARLFHTPGRRVVLLYAWHTAFCIIYALYTLDNVSDARGYYEAALQGNIIFSFGSAAVESITYFCVVVLGLSFLGTFLFYNIFGFIGLVAFDASLRVATADKSRNVRRLATVIILLPSISFWSSAIGKDSLSFLAVNLALWAALNFKRRSWLMVFAVLIMLLVRPHMAGIMIMALAGSQLIQRKVPLGRRLVFGGLALAASAVMVPLALDYAGVGSQASADDVMTYIEHRQQENIDGGSSVDIASMSLPMQLFTYLFRPLPFEAGSVFALAASADNTILCFLFVTGAWRILKRSRQTLMGNRAFMWLYAMLAWAILASTTANLGISMRQKWMFAPILIYLLISLASQPRRRPSARPVLRPQE